MLAGTRAWIETAITVSDTIELPSVCIGPTALMAANRYARWSVLPFIVSALVLASRLAHGFVHVGVAVFSIVVFGGGPAWIGSVLLRISQRVRRASRLATTDPTLRWYLVDNMVTATDAAGVPRPELTFVVTPQTRRLLTDLPRATAKLPPG